MSEATIRDMVRSGKDALFIREHAATVLSSGGDRDEMLRELQSLCEEFGNAGDIQSEDTVRDVMDFLVGWCSPMQRL
jgi:hypothetical protein